MPPKRSFCPSASRLAPVIWSIEVAGLQPLAVQSPRTERRLTLQNLEHCLAVLCVTCAANGHTTAARSEECRFLGRCVWIELGCDQTIWQRLNIVHPAERRCLQRWARRPCRCARSQARSLAPRIESLLAHRIPSNKSSKNSFHRSVNLALLSFLRQGSTHRTHHRPPTRRLL